MRTPTSDVAFTAPQPAVAPPPAQGRRHGRRGTNGRTRLLAALVTAALAAGAACLPAVRHQLRASFTRMPYAYQELYFTRAPVASGGRVVVPVTVRDHGEDHRSYRVSAWLRDARQHDTAAVTVPLTPRPTAAGVLRLPLPRGMTGPLTVYVQLLGHPQALHFRLGGRPANPAASAPATAPAGRPAPRTESTP